ILCDLAIGYGEIFSYDSHKRPVATATTRWMFSKDVGSGSSTIWRSIALVRFFHAFRTDVR
ncbi:MAG: hypothetical protein ACK50O_04885, partial [Pirellulaceae bacterium]